MMCKVTHLHSIDKNMIKKAVKAWSYSKKCLTLQSQLARRDGRVVDCGGLENR